MQHEVAAGRGEVLVHVDVAVVAARHDTRAVGVEELELVGANLLDKELLVGVCEKLGFPLQHVPVLFSTRCHVDSHVAVWIVEGIDAVGCGYGYNHPILSFRIVVNVSRDKKGNLKYILRDGPSYTGTFVDNEILGDRERRVIEDGTLFTIGATSIILRATEEEK